MRGVRAAERGAGRAARRGSASRRTHDHTQRTASPPALAEYCCNGTVVEDEESGKVLQLQGDQRKNVSTFLVANSLCKKDQVKVHGF